ncbi:LysE family translocator [Falsiroseomonas oryzae]|uniref:LysE family translocator n=1 Tax=Falsiroseomonas oryzae TaxID=2766473 RepID=UPI0022EB2312|nr:LysE family translocator [Roseomonas sp. MO-31]
MPEWHTLLILAGIALGLAATPGANMAYLMSRSMAQGRAAGFVSLAGTNAGLLLVMLVSVAGLASLLTAMPHLWEAIRLAGAAGLLWLAWGYLKPGGGHATVAAQDPALPPDPPARLFGLGFATSALNPKVAAFFIAGLPHLIVPADGSAVTQGLVLGLTYIAINTCCDVAIVLGAERFAHVLQRRPALAQVQQRAVGGAMVLVALALTVDAVT